MARNRGLAVAFTVGLALACGGASAAIAPPTPAVVAREDAERALARYRAQLKDVEPALQPKTLAFVRTEIAVALAQLGEATPGPAGAERLDEAIAALGQAQETFTREDFPQNWALLQMNIATVYTAIGQRPEEGGGLGALQLSAAAYRGALEVYARDKFPAQWAEIELGLGAVLSRIGDQLDQADREAVLAQAVDCGRNALTVYSRQTAPAEWSAGQNTLGVALKDLADTAEAKTDLLTQSIAAYTAALQVRTPTKSPQDWVNSTLGLAVAEAALADAERDPKQMRRAIDRTTGLIYALEDAQHTAGLMRRTTSGDDELRGLGVDEAARSEAAAKANREQMRKALPRLQPAVATPPPKPGT